MKKSQLSIFILLGMVMLSVVSVAVYTSNSLAETKTQEQLELTLQAATAAGSFDEFVNKCLASAMDDGMYLISKQGGKIYTMQVPGHPNLPQEHPFFEASQESVYEREVDLGVVIKNVDRVYLPITIKKKDFSTDCGADAIKVAPYYPEKDCAVRYVYYDSDYNFGSFPKLNQLCNAGKGPNKKDPEKGETCGVYYNNYGTDKTIQDQLTAYVQQYMEYNCFTDADLKAIFPNIELKSKRPEVEIMVGDEDLIANISYPFELKVKNIIPVTKTMNYLYRYDSRIKKVHRWASSMLYDYNNEWSKLNYEIERDAPLSPAYVPETSVKVLPHRPGDINIVEITDPLSQIKGREMKFQFAIKNRPPVLQLTGKPNDYGYAFVFYAGDEINIPVYAMDPDEKDVEIGTQTDPPSFRFVYVGWMQNYEDTFETVAPQPAPAAGIAAVRPAVSSACDIQEKMKKFTEVKELKMSAAADTNTNSRREKYRQADEKIKIINTEMEKCQIKKKVTEKHWQETREKGKSNAKISYQTRAPKYKDAEQKVVENFGDVGLHYLEVYVYDLEGLYDFQNISILVIPRFAGQIDPGETYDDIRSGQMSLEDIYKFSQDISNYKIKFKYTISGRQYEEELTSNKGSIPDYGAKIDEILEKHPLKELHSTIARGPISLMMELTEKSTLKKNSIVAVLTQCLPHMSKDTGDGVVAIYPYNTVTVDKASKAAALTGKAYKASSDPYSGEHTCCYGTLKDEIDDKRKGTVKPDTSACFSYKENTCLVNQYENNRQPDYPSEEHYFSLSNAGSESSLLPSNEAASSGNSGKSSENYNDVFSTFSTANSARKKPLWPATKSGEEYGNKEDDINLKIQLSASGSSLSNSNLNDVFTRAYAASCGGTRGNVCDGKKEDVFKQIGDCSSTQYCKYGESECQDWSYDAKDPLYDKVCDKSLSCVSEINSDSGRSTNIRSNEAAFIVRYVADGGKSKNNDQRKSVCEAAAINEPVQDKIGVNKIEVISGPAYTYNDITNNGLLSAKEKVFVGVDCNYYDGKRYETTKDKVSNNALIVPKESITWMHYAVDSAGRINEETGLLGQPKPGVLAVDYDSCLQGTAAAPTKCVGESVDPDTPCSIDKGDNCFGIKVDGDANGDGFWCNSIFGKDGCKGKSCWNLGFGDAENKGDFISYSAREIYKPSKNLCCGDDENEFPVKCEGTDACPEKPKVACCNSQTSCVFENEDRSAAECVASGQTRDFVNTQLMCLNGKWQDLDSNKISCEKTGYKYSENKKACCGDDVGDFWINGDEVCCDGELSSGNIYCGKDDAAGKSWIVNGNKCGKDYVSMPLVISGGQIPVIGGASSKISIDGSTYNSGLKCGSCNADVVTACRKTADNRLEGVCAYRGVNALTETACYTEGQPASKLGYGIGKNQKNAALIKIINGCSQSGLACSVSDLSKQTGAMGIVANGICDGVTCKLCKIKDEKADCDNNFDADCDGLAGNSDSDCTGCQNNNPPCGAGQTCISNSCKKNNGVACTSASECVNGRCNSGYCSQYDNACVQPSCSGTYYYCAYSVNYAWTFTSCLSGNICTNGVCKKANSQLCVSGAECANGYCNSGKCSQYANECSQPQCSGTTNYCAWDSANNKWIFTSCPSGQICSNGACQTPLKANGQPCSSPSECVGGFCNQGLSGKVCSSTANTCTTPRTCQNNAPCDWISGSYYAAKGTTCGAGQACISNGCVNLPDLTFPDPDSNWILSRSPATSIRLRFSVKNIGSEKSPTTKWTLYTANGVKLYEGSIDAIESGSTLNIPFVIIPDIDNLPSTSTPKDMVLTIGSNIPNDGELRKDNNQKNFKV